PEGGGGTGAASQQAHASNLLAYEAGSGAQQLPLSDAERLVIGPPDGDALALGANAQLILGFLEAPARLAVSLAPHLDANVCVGAEASEDRATWRAVGQACGPGDAFTLRLSGVSLVRELRLRAGAAGFELDAVESPADQDAPR